MTVHGIDATPIRTCPDDGFTLKDHSDGEVTALGSASAMCLEVAEHLQRQPPTVWWRSMPSRLRPFLSSAPGRVG